MGSINTLLIAANLVCYFIAAQAGEAALAAFALWPLGRFVSPELQTEVGFQPWQLLTSAFLHASPLHLLLNMLGLYSFGRDVEATLGARRYLILYLLAVLTAGLVQLVVVSTATGTPYATVGASGGVFGVLLAFGRLFPHRMVMLLFPPVPMPAWLLVTLFGAIEVINGVWGTQAGIAHFAHLGGMLGALMVLHRWRIGGWTRR